MVATSSFHRPGSADLASPFYYLENMETVVGWILAHHRDLLHPGDRQRLQDHQRRWLQFFARHGIPASVCYLRWQPAAVNPGECAVS